MSRSSEQDKIRAFIAVVPGRESLEKVIKIVDKLKKEVWAKEVRWVPEKNCHVTLRFLGDIDPHVIPGLLASLKKEIGKLTCFNFDLSHIVLLPSPSRPRVIAAEIDQSELLMNLAGAVEASAVRCGFEQEKKRFRGHITLGRCKKSFPRKYDIQEPFKGLSIPVNEITLMKSQLTGHGAIYSSIGRVSLKTVHGDN